MKTRVISFANYKGGVGKTTTTVNLGSSLARRGFKVLLLDLDPQSNLTTSLGVTEGEEPNMFTSFRDREGFRPLKLRENLFLVPSHLDLSAMELNLVPAMGREYVLKKLIGKTEGDFDFILIDCPPSLGLLTVNSFACSDEVIVPVQPQFLSVQGVAKLTKIVSDVRDTVNPSLRFGGVLITQFDGRKNLNKEIVETLRNTFKEVMFTTVIRDNVSIAESSTRGVDVYTYNPKSNGAVDYESMCEEFLEREGITTEKQ